MIEEEKDITMNDIKEEVESYMDAYNRGELSQEKVSILLKMSELMRTSFKVEREFNEAESLSKK